MTHNLAIYILVVLYLNIALNFWMRVRKKKDERTIKLGPISITTEREEERRCRFVIFAQVFASMYLAICVGLAAFSKDPYTVLLFSIMLLLCSSIIIQETREYYTRTARYLLDWIAMGFSILVVSLIFLVIVLQVQVGG